ncbi:hypothetical protein CES86_4832 [Brucella lupini]|uniref:Uncharacterized protein n=1 Tax=Brucella lupini TaxID=255457 RepID=A0A256GCA2_9HYPH|nr:hypothetical protein CES86_4832 [Brucella lupini]
MLADLDWLITEAPVKLRFRSESSDQSGKLNREKECGRCQKDRENAA